MKTVTKTVLVPPEGGWGWMIVLASALNNIIVIPIIQCFGILFKDKFQEIGISATEITILINFNFAFGMSLGLINGPLLNNFGYRKIAFISAIIYAIGIFATAWANTFFDYMITYGVIASLGLNLLTASFQLAINTYFKKRRNKAVGFTVTLTGLGPVFMPYVIGFSVIYYGVEDTLILLSALALNSVVASLLLQPVKWHMKEMTVEEEVEEEKEKLLVNGHAATEVLVNTIGSNTMLPRSPRSRKASECDDDIDIDCASVYGYETQTLSRHGSVISILTEKSFQGPVRRISRCERANALVEEIETTDHSGKDSKNIANIQIQITESNNDNEEDKKNDTNPEEKTSLMRSIGQKLVTFFDLDLLTDFTYVNLMVGMSIAIFAEINFSLLTPFMLNDFAFDTKQIATIMSLIGAFDIVFRFISPFVGDYLNASVKQMYMISMVCLIISRSCIIFFQTYDAMIVIAIMLGISKGIRTVYMSLVIPAHVPLERLASATGLQMVLNGIILLTVGPILGIIRDKTGSYSNCLIIINFVTFLTLFMWTVEHLWRVRRRKRKNRKNRDGGSSAK